MIEKKANTLKMYFMIHEAYISPPPQQTLECKLFFLVDTSDVSNSRNFFVQSCRKPDSNSIRKCK